jgi:WD40 repeat protein
MSKTFRKTLVITFTFVLSSFFAAAQSAPVLTNNAEYDIGIECPVGQTLSPDGTVLWVLTVKCAPRGGGTLTAYSVADGTTAVAPFSIEADDTLPVSTIDHFTRPLALTTDGNLSIRTIDNETYAPGGLVISPDGSGVTTPVIDDATLNDLLLSVSEYPEGAIYNNDHTRVAITGSTALTVFDLTTGETVLSLPVEEETYNAYPSFSPDGQTLYVARLDDLDDVESYDATVTSYDLTDGSETGSFAAPSFIVWVSPDGKYAAAERGSNDGTVSELLVVDTESGAVSEPYSLYEPARPLAACTNDGRNMSDVGFTVSGTLQLTGLNWLPDSSGFVITRSYGGEASGGGSVCTFDTSRLNVIEVNGGR